ncbi:MAG: hypothetical protein IT181_02870 [Acidobacteria bacterium]|nr:hypothetical protein [Acidobacteriota bacterium]
MTLLTTLVAELDRETKRSRRTLEQIPGRKRDWKPHDRSMALGPLADMVAMIPMWVSMILDKDELDIAPQDGSGMKMPQPETSAEYLAVLDTCAAEARQQLEATTETHLQSRWKLLTGGKVAQETTRLEMITDTINHWAHHRGQMTVCLRLLGATVPALYGPSADDTRFEL